MRYSENHKTMSKGILLFSLIICIANSLLSQSLTRENLISDLQFLNDATVHGHPVNYNNDINIDILPIIETVKRLEKDSFTPLEYESWIEKGLYHMGCVHTWIIKNTLFSQNNSKVYIPLTVAIQNDILQITACSDSTQIGKTLHSINGVPSVDIIDHFKEYRGSDGLTDAFSKAYFHYLSSRLIAKYLQNAVNYRIVSEDGDFELKATNKMFGTELDEDFLNIALSNNKNKLYVKDGSAILKLNKFYKSDVRFYKKVFQEIEDLKLDTLIIDVRQNLGGERKAAVALTKYLVDSTFSYSLLKPKRTRAMKYLNGKGKFFHFLSILKYYGGNIYRIRKSEFGPEFRYTYKPHTKEKYDGKVYVITDGFTCSASTMVTSWIRKHSNATFLGSQAGGGYNGNNGGSFPIITLPNSKIVIRFPTYRLILDNESKERTGIVPDVHLESFSSYDNIFELLK